MKYKSTRSALPAVSLTDALTNGLAPDGGLYVPTEFPQFSMEERASLQGKTHAEIARAVLEPYFLEDTLHPKLDAICTEAFDIPTPLVEIGHDTSVLELFHGLSSAFKDYGARMLASCMTRIHEGDDPLTILVATSGDTGGAVAAAFHDKPGIEVIILYPRDHVSARQAHQLACWGGNVRTFAVTGDFDACQAMAKAAFSDAWWLANKNLTSANSINIGRLLPQMTYYAASSTWYEAKHGVEAGFIIPSGNVGNALAAVWAREMGFPIREICLASNANQSIVNWIESGEYKGFQTVHTIANAMDVGSPSNMERLVYQYPEAPDWLSAMSFDDATIRETIRHGEERWGQVFCPHTACAVAARERLDSSHWVVVATAHPAKFETIVEPLVGHEVPMPPALAALMHEPTQLTEIPPTLEALTEALS